MLEQLEKIDGSVIDELMAIKEERGTIADRLQKMEAEKGKVTEQVYRRVRRDYESRTTELERKAAPLKERARSEFARLKVLLDQIESKHAAAKLDREELELRHRLGEFADGAFDEKVGEIEARLAEHADQLERATEVKERFVGAFDSEEELATAPPAPLVVPVAAPEPVAPAAPPPPAAPIPAPTAAAPAAAPTGAVATAAPGPGLALPSFGPSAAVAIDPTAVTAPQPVPPIPAAPEPVAPAAAPPAPADEAPQDGTVILGPVAPTPPPAASRGATVILSSAKLEAVDTDLGARDFALQPLSFVGRTPENQVRLNRPAVSRRHAQLSQTEGGWLLKDLQSENGTWVNGDKISERLLGDGDRVQFGTVRLIFRAK